MDEFTVRFGFKVAARKTVMAHDSDEAMETARATLDEIVKELRKHCGEYQIEFNSEGITVI